MLVRKQKYRLVRTAWAPSLARRILRHRVVWLIVVVMVGVVAAMSMSTRVAAVEAERVRWGTSTSVLVVTSPVAIGEPVGDAVETRDVPVALAPDGALSELGDASLAKVDLYPGEILLGSRVTGSAASEVPAGMVAITSPVTTQMPLLSRGDLVDLWSVDSANLVSRRVAERVTVLDFSDHSVTVAAPHDQVEALTVASIRSVTITLIG